MAPKTAGKTNEGKVCDVLEISRSKLTMISKKNKRANTNAPNEEVQQVWETMHDTGRIELTIATKKRIKTEDSHEDDGNQTFQPTGGEPLDANVLLFIRTAIGFAIGEHMENKELGQAQELIQRQMDINDAKSALTNAEKKFKEASELNANLNNTHHGEGMDKGTGGGDNEAIGNDQMSSGPGGTSPATASDKSSPFTDNNQTSPGADSTSSSDDEKYPPWYLNSHISDEDD